MYPIHTSIFDKRPVQHWSNPILDLIPLGIAPKCAARSQYCCPSFELRSLQHALQRHGFCCKRKCTSSKFHLSKLRILPNAQNFMNLASKATWSVRASFWTRVFQLTKRSLPVLTLIKSEVVSTTVLSFVARISWLTSPRNSQFEHLRD